MNRRKLAAARAEAKERKALLGDFLLEDVHLYRCDRHTFTIFVGGDTNAPSESGEHPGVEHNMADRFEMNLSILSGINKTRPILVNLSSCGGDWNAGMKMFSAILTCPNPVTVLGTFDCRSMTSLIPLAADRFLMRPMSKYMIHYGSWSVGEIPQQLMDTLDMERRSENELMKRIYIARLREQGAFCEWSERRIRTMLEENFQKHIDVWLSADEAAKQGFSDGVFTGDTTNMRAAKKNTARRAIMLEVLRKPINIDVRVS